MIPQNKTHHSSTLAGTQVLGSEGWRAWWYLKRYLLDVRTGGGGGGGRVGRGGVCWVICVRAAGTGGGGGGGGGARIDGWVKVRARSAKAEAPSPRSWPCHGRFNFEGSTDSGWGPN